jgi:hypothetical protein
MEKRKLGRSGLEIAPIVFGGNVFGWSAGEEASSEVLDAYDTRLAVGGGFDRRAEILEEAARIAKDFIGDHARAVGYLEQLFRLRPADGQVASSLERLLERHERWPELVAARRFRLEMLAGPEARELRLRIATTLSEA